MSASSRGGPVPQSSGGNGVRLLIAFAVGLCCLVVWQWIGDASVREKNGSLVRAIEALGIVTNECARTLESIRGDRSRVEEIRTALEFQIKTNRAEVRRLQQELIAAARVTDRSASEVRAYKQSLDRANQVIRDQNVAVTKQNETVEELKKMALDRNDLVKKYNDLGKEYESLIKERNGFVQKLNKLAQVASEKN